MQWPIEFRQRIAASLNGLPVSYYEGSFSQFQNFTLRPRSQVAVTVAEG